MKNIVFIAIALFICFAGKAQSNENHWSNQERQLRYLPDNDDFVITNGDKRFNRALYGTETPFRVEAGDLPEFAFYMPGFGGNMQFGIKSADGSKWLTDAKNIEARYRPGCMIYTITDDLLGDGKLVLTIWALADKEGAIFKVDNQSSKKDLSLIFTYGGANGKKFRRNGDLNTDPESIFYLTPKNCEGNVYSLLKNSFHAQFGKGDAIAPHARFLQEKPEKPLKKWVMGVVPSKAKIKLADANKANNLSELLESEGGDQPVLVCEVEKLKQTSYYFSVFVPSSPDNLKANAKNMEEWCEKAETSRQKLANRIKVKTPDAFINNLGATLAVAADGIYETPTYLHGAIGWRIRLPGWRGPYTADPLGWHDRAVTHFRAYAESQVTSPDSGPSVLDEKRNWARQEEKMGNALFTSGYICRDPNGKIRPHHYDMNLVFIDAMLRHFKWTGDLEYVREMWTVLMRHLAWEKRNFDGDNDGLYDAYCCIWASDALEYSGGAVSHSSAYNYFANKMVSQLAQHIGEDPQPFTDEADKILAALQNELWLEEKGWFAEYKDWSGEQRTHDASALWTIYHVLDSEVADPFQLWQSTQYVSTEIPKLPVQGKGLKDEGYYVHSTTNWQPYDWSINNVVMAENLHTALAYWQAGRGDEAYKLWKSTLLDAMYLGSSPGNFAQLSYLDAARGEMYRDFADEVGMTARSLVEGLFGITPNALAGELLIQPGFPSSWNEASLSIPDIDLDFKKTEKKSSYTIIPKFQKQLKLTLKLPAAFDEVANITLNGKAMDWSNDSLAIEFPVIEMNCGIEEKYIIEITWAGNAVQKINKQKTAALHDSVQWMFSGAKVLDVYDPQKVMVKPVISNNKVSGVLKGTNGVRTFFVQLQQNSFTWWMPQTVEVKAAIEIVPTQTQESGKISFTIKNNSNKKIEGNVYAKGEDEAIEALILKPGTSSTKITVEGKSLVPGSNEIEFKYADKHVSGKVINWDIDLENKTSTPLAINDVFNEELTQIFKNEYASPRWPYPTLQLPKHGIGNWCYNNIHPTIDDAGLRQKAGDDNSISTLSGITFSTPEQADSMNIAFVSQWDNYPKQISLPLEGEASHLYLLMAGSTNPMQSQIVNGVILVEYTDCSKDSLELINPQNWWPIEQDYFQDGYAYETVIPFPPRVHLKTGLITRDFDGYTSINGFSNRIIEGGAATVLDMPLNSNKELKSLTLKALSNEVVIGLMSATLITD